MNTLLSPSMMLRTAGVALAARTQIPLDHHLVGAVRAQRQKHAAQQAALWALLQQDSPVAAPRNISGPKARGLFHLW
jgi:hypothetical protein